MGMSTDFRDLVHELERDPEERSAIEHARERFTLGAMLLERRTAAGFTQKDLADASGIPQSEISRIERGQANPTLQTIEALGAPLGVSLSLTDRTPVVGPPRVGVGG